MRHAVVAAVRLATRRPAIAARRRSHPGRRCAGRSAPPTPRSGPAPTMVPSDRSHGSRGRKLPAMAEIAAPPPLSLRTQVLRFVVTGGFSAVVDFGLYLVAVHRWSAFRSTSPRPSASSPAPLTAYLINRRWTFQARAQPGPVRRGDGALCADLRRPGRASTTCALRTLRGPGLGGAGGVRHRPGHRDGDQLHRPAACGFSGSTGHDRARTVPSSRCPQRRPRSG